MDATNNYIHIADPNEGEMPSMKYGQEVFVAFILAVVVFAGVMTGAIIYCSRIQEKVSSHMKESKFYRCAFV